MFRHNGLPMVFQNEVAECALACIAMLAAYHGHDVDLAALRRRFPSSLKGTTLKQMIEIARALSLDTRPLRVELEGLSRLAVPCVLHWDLNHFVVLKRISSRGLDIHDPARGAYRLSLAEASTHFTGVALEFSRSASFRPQRERRTISLRSLAGQVAGLPSAIAQVAVLALAVELLVLATPLYLQWVIDDVLVSDDAPLLNLLGLAFVAAVAFETVFTVARGWISSGVGTTLGAQWTVNLFGHLLKLPLAYFEKRHVGDLISRFGSLQTIQQTLTGQFVESALDGITALLVFAILLAYSPSLTAIIVLVLVAYAVLRWCGYRLLRAVKEEYLARVVRQQTQLIEAIRGVQAIKLANQQGERSASMANATVEVSNRDATVQRIGLCFSTLGQMLFGLQRVCVVWLAARAVIAGQFSAGMMVVFVMYADQFATRMRALGDRAIEFGLLRVHTARIAEVALAEPESDAWTGYTGPVPEPAIDVQGLSFRYGDDEPWVLRNASFRIEAGRSVAIVGVSGSGKTTLAKLLLGLMVPSDGRIAVGGVDVRKYGLDAYRRMCGAVMQDDHLFAGSIAANIAFFDPAADGIAIQAAAARASIHDDIVAMPMGYETLVGDMGSSLSGGQKQRVLLARALYRDPRILVLDEATSHLDIARERSINSVIGALHMTRLIIAHRPETIASADEILEVTDGQVTPVDMHAFLSAARSKRA